MYVIQTIAKQEYKVQTFLQSSGVIKDSESLWIPMKPKLMHSRNDVGGNQGSRGKTYNRDNGSRDGRDGRGKRSGESRETRDTGGTKVWTEVKDILLPGYILVDTPDPWDFKERYSKHGVSGFHLIGRTQSAGRDMEGDDYEPDEFIPVTDAELNLIRSLCGEISKGVKEGSRVRIISGPLVGLQGNVQKLNPHHRCALVRLEMFGRSLDVWLSFEIIVEDHADTSLPHG